MTALKTPVLYLCAINYSLQQTQSYMKKVIFTALFFAGMAATQLSAQSQQCTPSPGCCSKKEAAACKVGQTDKACAKQCTPEEMKKCTGGTAASNTEKAAPAPKQAAVITSGNKQ
jgi:hypothetical protein